MPLNTNLALSYQAPQMENPLNSLAKIAAIQQAQQAQQMNALKYDQYSRDTQNLNAMRQYLAAGGKPEGLVQFGEVGIKALDAMVAGQRAGAAAEKDAAEARAKQIAADTENVQYLQSLARLGGREPSDAFVHHYASTLAARKVFSSDAAEAVRAKLLQLPPNERAAMLDAAATSAKDALKQHVTQDTGGATSVGGWDPVAGKFTPGAATLKTLPPTLTTVGTGIAGETQPAIAHGAYTSEGTPGVRITTGIGPVKKTYPPAPPAPTLVTIQDPVTNKPVVVDARQVAPGPGGMIGVSPKPSEAERLSAKDLAAREAKRPQATLALQSFEAKADEMARDIDALIKHPGLNSITGLVYGRTPSVTAEGRAAQALYDKIVAAGGFGELSAMRQASPNGGALGNVSDRENQQLKQAFGAIDRTQATGDLVKALKDVRDKTIAAKERVRDAYDLTYEYRQDKETPAKESPAAAAPMYAVNPKTGERIESSDGGKTWRPVGGK